VLARNPGAVTLVYRHFPLERIHRFARQAAIASECASRQGRFAAYHDALFAEDSLGPDKWMPLARGVGVADTAAFAACLEDSTAEQRVDADVLAGSELRVDGTPTILVNQYRLTDGAPPQVIDSLIQLLLQRK
jgi:protein-disulfide isomerase